MAITAPPFSGTAILNPPSVNQQRIAELLGGIPRYNVPAEAAAVAPEIAGTGRLARLAGMFGEGGKLAAGGAGRAGLYGVGGILAGQAANKLVGEHGGTSADEALTGALTGAGIGAGIGSFLPGPGTLIGGAVGGVAGGLIGAFGHKSTGKSAVSKEFGKQSAALTQLAQSLHLDADTTNLIAQQLGAYTLNAKSEGEVRAAAQQIAQQLPDIAQQALATRQNNLRAMAVQSAMASFASPYLQGAATQSALTHSQLNDAADQIGGQTGKLLKLHAQETRSTQDNLLAAYATQISMAPQTSQYDTLTQLRNQANSQLYAKLAGQAAGGGNSSALTQQIAQLGQGQ